MKREGIISIDSLGVDFWGYNEGSASPCSNEQEIQQTIQQIIKRHGKEYNIKIVDERVKQKTLF